MRALTVRQPWAWAIIHGGKDVENRTRNIAGMHRGPIALHTSREMDVSAIGDERIAGRYMRTHDTTARAPLWRLGYVIGVVDLVDVHRPERCDGSCSPWAEEGRVHLILANPRPLTELVRCGGRLGLWTLPDDIADAVARAT